MSRSVTIAFSPLRAEEGPGEAGAAETLVIFVASDLKPAPAAAALLGPAVDLVAAGAEAARFKGKNRTAMEFLAPAGLRHRRLIVVGIDAKPATTVAGGAETAPAGKTYQAWMMGELDAVDRALPK